MYRNGRPRTLLLLLVLSCLTGACAGQTAPDRVDAEFKAPEQAPGAASPGGPQAGAGGILSFTAPKLGGGQVVGSELAGRHLAVWFWAPW